MNREAVFTPEELTELSLALREVQEIDDYCKQVQRVFGETFELAGGYPFCYHFYDGQLHLPQMPPIYKKEWLNILGKYKFFEKSMWNALGLPYLHSTANPVAIEDPEEYDKILEFGKGGEFMFAMWTFENEILLGLSGIARPLESGDFTRQELENIRMLLPFWEEGMKESARFSRAKLLGGDFAAIVENHPNGLLLFDAENRLIYSNHAAKLVIQEEPRPGSRAPCAQISQIPTQLIAKKHEAGLITLPLGKSATIKHLPDWPELGLKKPWLAIVHVQPVELPLSERESDVLRAYALEESTEKAAASIGTTVSTYRTHLGNISQKLGVSGSNAALTLWYLSGRNR